ncbi:RNA-directed DNA polymerase, eukaryota [Tanacetum coccineum]
MGNQPDDLDSRCSGRFKKSVAPRTGGYILCLMEEVVKVGQTMRYNMEGCVKDIMNIIESRGASSETKMESMELTTIKSCWGNYAFDYVHSDAVVVVYAPHDLKDKCMLWDYLTYVSNHWDGEVMMMGDFNEVRFKSDRFGSFFNERGADMFNSFISNASLEEVPLGGCAYTWCHKSASKMSKLDRFLISKNLMHKCPNICAITLDRFISDHRPILLRESSFDYGPTPFRFFHYWMEVDGFNEFVNILDGQRLESDHNGMRNMLFKLKFLKSKIREWINVFKYNSKAELIRLKGELQAVDGDIDNGNGSDEVVSKRTEIINSMLRLNKIKASEAAQKAKIKWSVEGDENSSFFHGMLNKNRSQLSIRGVMADGVWIENPDLVKDEFVQHFSSRFGKPTDIRASIDMNFPKVLSSVQKEELECDVSKEELKRAVWDCGMDKSPGPDGFTFGFFRKFWSTIENDVYEAVTYFFTNGDIPKGCNSSFIALIPKTPGANMVKDFRPISLIGCMYKIIAKILTNRLVGVIGDIVNEVQSAFIADRQILDGPFILNEVMHWCTVKKKQALIFKVDFEKAYDSVRWDFLDEVLQKFGFGNKWRMWIQSSLRSSRGSILVNGSPTEEFQFYRGLKQGDPLSPFLFILIMESLHLSFQRVVDAGMFTGINLSPSVNLSHMFYADDAVFIGHWNDGNINTLVNVLECFYRASGLRINMCKSKIMGIHVEGDLVKHAASKLGCLILNTPFVYLGTKVGGKMSRVKEWNEVVDKVVSRLSKWKMKTLSIGGRLTLLKSVLGSIPIFHMSIYRVPSRVLQQLESIRNRFFNGNDLGSKKAIWIKWSNVLADKAKGGLGVSSLYALNRGLMIKWLWRFYAQNTSLWVRVVKLYCRKKEGGSNISSRSIMLVNIVKEVSVLQAKGVNVMNYVRLKLGNGESTSFWEDNWINGGVLKDVFPRLYALEMCKKVSLDILSVMVREVGLVPMSDRYIWSLEGSGDFSVASIRKVIDDKFLPNVSYNICDGFKKCLSRQIVRKVSSWWNVDYVGANSYEEWLDWLGSLRLPAKLKLMLEGVFYVV